MTLQQQNNENNENNEYEEIQVTLRLHKDIATILRIFSKAYSYNDDENDTDDVISYPNNTTIAVSKKRIEDFLSHEITNTMKQLGGEVIKDEEKQFPDSLKRLIKILLNEVTDSEELEELEKLK